jgi:uncharacterized protein YndB with AHSA1/START domain
MLTDNSSNLIVLTVAFVICSIVPAAQAKVLDADAHGFTIRISTTINAERMAVYKAAVENIGAWWHGDHTISGFSSNLYIDPRVPGCFCENLGRGAGIVHMAVTYVSPGIILRLTGGLGPLGLMGVDGNMTWEFDDAGEGTLMTLNYAVGGYDPDGLDTLAPAVNGVLEEAMMRLRAFAETGDAEGQQ